MLQPNSLFALYSASRLLAFFYDCQHIIGSLSNHGLAKMFLSR